MIGALYRIFIVSILSMVVVSAVRSDPVLKDGSHENEKNVNSVRISRNVLDTEYRYPGDLPDGSQYMDNLQDDKKRANSMMHFGKKRANSMMHFGKKRANSMMHFGKKRANSMMHFGKKANSMMHFGKRPAMNSMVHFGKRANSMMHFGKRANSMMHFGKRANSMMHFGKRANSMMHFGKRANRMMHFGKRANSMMHFGKRPANSMVHFGKRPANALVHFGKREPESNPVHFEKRSIDENKLNQVLREEDGEKRSHLPQLLDFGGPRYIDNNDYTSENDQLEGKDLYDNYNSIKRSLERSYGLSNFPLKLLGSRQTISIDDLSLDDLNRLYNIIYESYLSDKSGEEPEDDDLEEDIFDNMMEESKRSTSKKMDLYNRQAKNAMIHFG